MYEDDPEIEERAEGTLARVQHISGDGRELILELRNGQFLSVSASQPTELVLGAIVLVGDNTLDPLPGDLWPDPTYVAVVKVKTNERTVLETGARWRLVETNHAVDYAVGNTVEVSEVVGIVGVLQEEPLKHVDLGEVDESTLQAFMPSAGETVPTFDDFGGFPDVVRRARDLIEIPLQHHDRLATINARPVKGVLFSGPPGGGKTMLARIVAHQSGAEFLVIRGPQFVSKWVGQSEEVLRLIFDYAKQKPRSIIFFDEVDSIAGRRTGDTHESSRRIVTQLLTEMDGFAPADNVVVIAATNRPEDIDPALLRPGRFDWEIVFPEPTTTDREAILRTSQSRHNVRGKLPHADVAEATAGWSGAELTAIWTEAALLAVDDERDAICAEDFLGGFERVAQQLAEVGRNRRREAH